MKDKETGLTDKQEAFCQEYNTNGYNATAAYKAVYSCENWKEEHIYSKASALANNGKVSARIKQLRAEAAQLSKVKREDVESVQNAIASCDVWDFYIEDNGVIRVRQLNELTERGRKAAKAPKFNAMGELVGWELDNKTNAAKLLGTWNSWESPREVNMNAVGLVGAEMRIGYKKPEEE